jgi:hypothetical protein
LERRILLLATVILAAIALIIALGYFIYISKVTPASTPVPAIVFDANISVANGPMIVNQAGPPPYYYTNVTQGDDLEVNVTVTSTGLEELIFVKSIEVWWYNPEVNLYTWYYPPIGNASAIQTNAFSYSSTPNPVSLQPYMSNFTIVTLHIAKDAPTGQYSMYINLGAELEESGETPEFAWLDQAYWFSMIINP